MTWAFVCLALASSAAGLSQAISTKDIYLPSDLADQLKGEFARDHDICPSLSESVETTWLRLRQGDPLAVRLDGRGCMAGVTNRSILLYSRSGSTWRKVLDATGNGMYTLPSRSQGWRDLEVVQHVNAFIGTYLIYRFDGLEYKPVDCVEVDRTRGGPPRRKHQTCSFDWKASNDR
jgi:hypothetical protein